MTKYSITLFFLMSVCNTNGQDCDSTIIIPSQIQNFFTDLKWTPYFKTNALIVSSPSQVNGNLFTDKRNYFDSIFSKEDLKFIKTQINASKNLEWSSLLIDSVSFISKNNLDSLFKANRRDGSLGWIAFREIERKSGYFEISVPYFSKDKQYCLVYFSHHCGMTCGEGRLGVFKFQGGKWILFKTVTYWVS